mmetsp:Transcript_28187/g.70762  ORF Transcript_28187/g.70762 Transcript_28187/m.70762 type:complete len:237 (+) Transcript_28187:791-1501(+)
MMPIFIISRPHVLSNWAIERAHRELISVRYTSWRSWDRNPKWASSRRHCWNGLSGTGGSGGLHAHVSDGGLFCFHASMWPRSRMSWSSRLSSTVLKCLVNSGGSSAGMLSGCASVRQSSQLFVRYFSSSSVKSTVSCAGLSAENTGGSVGARSYPGPCVILRVDAGSTTFSRLMRQRGGSMGALRGRSYVRLESQAYLPEASRTMMRAMAPSVVGTSTTENRMVSLYTYVCAYCSP